jgi:hypothetical protein
MTQAIQHAQFEIVAALEDHLAENGETLSELLLAYADIEAMAALSRLRNGVPQPRARQQVQIIQIRDCLANIHGADGGDRSDFSAAVRWHGARLDEIISFFST